MGKVCTKHILGLLSKMVENMFFLDSKHVGMGRMLPPKSCLFLHVVCLASKNYFARFFCCSYYYVVCSQSLQIKYHITRKTLFDPSFTLFFLDRVFLI